MCSVLETEPYQSGHIDISQHTLQKANVMHVNGHFSLSLQRLCYVGLYINGVYINPFFLRKTIDDTVYTHIYTKGKLPS